MPELRGKIKNNTITDLAFNSQTEILDPKNTKLSLTLKKYPSTYYNSYQKKEMPNYVTMFGGARYLFLWALSKGTELPYSYEVFDSQQNWKCVKEIKTDFVVGVIKNFVIIKKTGCKKIDILDIDEDWSCVHTIENCDKDNVIFVHCVIFKDYLISFSFDSSKIENYETVRVWDSNKNWECVQTFSWARNVYPTSGENYLFFPTDVYAKEFKIWKDFEEEAPIKTIEIKNNFGSTGTFISEANNYIFIAYYFCSKPPFYSTVEILDPQQNFSCIKSLSLPGAYGAARAFQGYFFSLSRLRTYIESEEVKNDYLMKTFELPKGKCILNIEDTAIYFSIIGDYIALTKNNAAVEIYQVPYRPVKQKDITKVLTLLLDNNSVKNLDLSGLALTKEHIKLLCELLRKNKNLSPQSINLDNTKIIDEKNKIYSDLTNPDNQSFFYIAVKKNWFPIVKILLQCFVSDVNKPYDKDFTVLHYAAQNGNVEILKFLLDNKADILALTYDGLTAYDIAVAANQTKIIEILKENNVMKNILQRIKELEETTENQQQKINKLTDIIETQKNQLEEQKQKLITQTNKLNEEIQKEIFERKDVTKKENENVEQKFKIIDDKLIEQKKQLDQQKNDINIVLKETMQKETNERNKNEQQLQNQIDKLAVRDVNSLENVIDKKDIKEVEKMLSNAGSELLEGLNLIPIVHSLNLGEIPKTSITTVEQLAKIIDQVLLLQNQPNIKKYLKRLANGVDKTLELWRSDKLENKEAVKSLDEMATIAFMHLLEKSNNVGCVGLKKNIPVLSQSIQKLLQEKLDDDRKHLWSKWVKNQLTPEQMKKIDEHVEKEIWISWTQTENKENPLAVMLESYEESTLLNLLIRQETLPQMLMSSGFSDYKQKIAQNVSSKLLTAMKQKQIPTPLKETIIRLVKQAQLQQGDDLIFDMTPIFEKAISELLKQAAQNKLDNKALQALQSLFKQTVTEQIIEGNLKTYLRQEAVKNLVKDYKDGKLTDLEEPTMEAKTKLIINFMKPTTEEKEAGFRQLLNDLKQGKIKNSEANELFLKITSTWQKKLKKINKAINPLIVEIKKIKENLKIGGFSNSNFTTFGVNSQKNMNNEKIVTEEDKKITPYSSIILNNLTVPKN